MNRPKFHKRYFPGLTSLAALPVLFICYLVNQGVFHKYQAITILWATKAQLNAWSRPYNKKFDIETFRKYDVLNISGNLKEDYIKFERLKKLHQELIGKSDKTKGIKIIFGTHATYDEFITVLDIGLNVKDDGLFLAPTGAEMFIGHVDISHVKLLPK